MESQDAYQRARKRAEAKLGFYIHLTVYVVVGALLVTINLTTSPDLIWVTWPLMGWGIGLLFHALGAFIFSGRTAITEQMIERELRRHP